MPRSASTSTSRGSSNAQHAVNRTNSHAGGGDPASGSWPGAAMAQITAGEECLDDEAHGKGMPPTRASDGFAQQPRLPARLRGIGSL